VRGHWLLLARRAGGWRSVRSGLRPLAPCPRRSCAAANLGLGRFELDKQAGQRTGAELGSLLQAAGFRLRNTTAVPLPAYLNVIERVPA
jgi:hypothetical protein